MRSVRVNALADITMVWIINRPFNLHPFISFEKMGAFAILRKKGRIFSGWQPEKKLGFIR
jgi:hypothetical protein